MISVRCWTSSYKKLCIFFPFPKQTECLNQMILQPCIYKKWNRIILKSNEQRKSTYGTGALTRKMISSWHESDEVSEWNEYKTKTFFLSPLWLKKKKYLCQGIFCKTFIFTTNSWKVMFRYFSLYIFSIYITIFVIQVNMHLRR